MKQIVTEKGIVEVGTIIVVHNQLSIVDNLNPNASKNPIEFKHKTTHRGYICNPSQIQAILGKCDIEKWNEIQVDAPKISKSKALFGIMAGVELNTPMQIRSRKGLELVTYTGFKYSRPKYPISFIRNGKAYKAPESIVVQVTRNGKLVPLNEKVN